MRLSGSHSVLLVDRPGVEPGPPRCERGVLPLSLSALCWWSYAESNCDRLHAMQVSSRWTITPATRRASHPHLAFRRILHPCGRRSLRRRVGGPGRNRTDHTDLAKVGRLPWNMRARLDLEGGVEPPMDWVAISRLTPWLHQDCWQRWRDSNPHEADLESARPNLRSPPENRAGQACLPALAHNGRPAGEKSLSPGHPRPSAQCCTNW